MGIINASPESFSQRGITSSPEAHAEHAVMQVNQGASVIDIGGQSATTDTPELTPEVEIARLEPVIKALRSRSDVPISIDTYKPEVAEACLAAGANIINDTSGLLYTDIADVVREHQATYVLMHNRGRPKQRLTDPNLYTDVVADVREFFHDRMAVLDRAGVAANQVIYDPGIDFSKTPAQTVTVLQASKSFEELGVPLLLAISRKDFIGAITKATPAERDPGTLATISFLHTEGVDCIVRVHDVDGAHQFLQVLDALSAGLDTDLLLDPENFVADGLDTGSSSDG